MTLVLARARRKVALALACASAVLIACNAIVGVEDVALKSPTRGPGVDGSSGGTGGGGDDDDSGGSGLPHDDAALPKVDRGTLALGFNHACARMPNGTVKCWGDNGAGELADGVPFESPTRLQQSLVPLPVPNLSDVVDIVSGLAHTCVIHKAGTVSCWGVNTFGQLGDGTKDRSSKPVDVVGLSDATSLGPGTSFTCAVRKDKTAVCWGANYSGQLGDGTKDDRGTPAPVKGLTGVISLTGANDHACAALESGEVLCWGGNPDGQLGIGSTAESLLPAKLGGLSNIAQVAAAARFTCAREQGGRVFCWGSNDFGQLGNGIPNTDPNPSPIIVPSIGDATFLWTGFEHACVVRKTGAVACWGRADDGQLGTGTLPDASIPTPVAVTGMPGAARAAWTGGNRSCAIAEDGSVYCWGVNTLGQLGNGTTDRAVKAVPISAFP
jgi:alpha-tubulin suppressor-like RCC1 family protein